MSDNYVKLKDVLAVIEPRLYSTKSGSLEYQRLYSITQQIKNLPVLSKEKLSSEEIERE